MIRAVVWMGVITCSQMPPTTNHQEKPATPDPTPPRNAASRNSPRTIPSITRSHDRGEQRLDGEVHLEGRPRNPLVPQCRSAIQKIRAQHTWSPPCEG